MHDIERYQHTLHAHTNGYKRKVERVNAIIDEAINTVAPDRWMVSYSGGVDSLVVLDMLARKGLLSSMLVRYVDDGWDYEDTIAFLNATEQRYGVHLQRMRSLHNWREWCIEMRRPDLGDDPAAYEAWGNPREWDGGWNSHQEWLQSLTGYDGVFLGLLASESRSRAYALHDGYKSLYQVKGEGGMWHCSPLAHFTKRDIWAYVTSHELPYNPVYDRLAELDVPLERRRVAPLTCFAVQQYGSGVILRAGWGELWNKLASTFPRIREYG